MLYSGSTADEHCITSSQINSNHSEIVTLLARCISSQLNTTELGHHNSPPVLSPPSLLMSILVDQYIARLASAAPPHSYEQYAEVLPTTFTV